MQKEAKISNKSPWLITRALAYNFLVARYALIGSPVSHSLSPALMARLGLDYRALEIEPVDLRDFMESQARYYSGLNITTPLKEAIIPFMDSISSEAREISGVNCAVRHLDSWEGHNTDHLGVAFAFDYLGISPKSVLIVGTGPGARAAAFALSSRRIDFLFMSRKPGPGRITMERLNPRILEDHDLIINAAPPGSLSLLVEFLGPHNFVLDMNYGERATDVSGTGTGFSDGIPVLIGQAAASLALWLGRDFGHWAEKLLSAAREMGAI